MHDVESPLLMISSPFLGITMSVLISLRSCSYPSTAPTEKIHLNAIQVHRSQRLKTDLITFHTSCLSSDISPPHGYALPSLIPFICKWSISYWFEFGIHPALSTTPNTWTVLNNYLSIVLVNLSCHWLH